MCAITSVGSEPKKIENNFQYTWGPILWRWLSKWLNNNTFYNIDYITSSFFCFNMNLCLYIIFFLFCLFSCLILRVCILKLEKEDHSNRSEPRLGCLDSGKEVTITEVSHAGLQELKKASDRGKEFLETGLGVEDSFPRRELIGGSWSMFLRSLFLPLSPLSKINFKKMY